LARLLAHGVPAEASESGIVARAACRQATTRSNFSDIANSCDIDGSLKTLLLGGTFELHSRARVGIEHARASGREGHLGL